MVGRWEERLRRKLGGEDEQVQLRFRPDAIRGTNAGCYPIPFLI